MAGEWIAYDLGLPEKPEVQELIDETGLPVESVVFLLLRLWGWASLNTTDGLARMTVARLVRTCGGTDAFWRAVAAVGWLEIDETAATVAIPRWDRRFSQAAKARLQARDREKAYDQRENRQPTRARGKPPALARGEPPAPVRGRGEERRGEVPPPPREALPWEDFQRRWNDGPGRMWSPPQPPEGWEERSAEPGWTESAVEAIERLRTCRYFSTPVSLPQFLGPRFVTLCLGGQYDGPKTPAKGGGSPAADGKASAEELSDRWQKSVEESAKRTAEYVAAKAARAAREPRP